mmetsp:Transcript_111956/g.194394  ORF Transcript_111956/g.194394 Transcript_111956/m.194394 type:complete len:99 (-) Transcript_111956:1546-1842(-)
MCQTSLKPTSCQLQSTQNPCTHAHHTWRLLPHLPTDTLLQAPWGRTGCALTCKPTSSCPATWPHTHPFLWSLHTPSCSAADPPPNEWEKKLYIYLCGV